MKHTIPFEKKQCIVRRKVAKCSFAENPEKSPESIFICAPSEQGEFVDYVKEIVKNEFDLNPVIALDMKDYNEDAFCSHICYSMLRSWIVIIIGDWKDKIGNVNVAFEHGIATAMGCEVIPIWIKGDKERLPFDISGLHAIIVQRNWNEDQTIKNDFTTEFIEAFKEKKAKMDILSMGHEVSTEQKQEIIDLISRFWTTLDQDHRKTTLVCLLEMARKDNRIFLQNEFVDWVIEIVGYYSYSLVPRYQVRVRNKKYELNDKVSLSLVEATISYNLNNHNSHIWANEKFHDSLSFLFRDNRVDLLIRQSALSCLISLIEFSSDTKLLLPIRDVIEDIEIDEGTYATFDMPTKLRLCRDRNLGLSISVSPILDLLERLKDASNPIIKKRYSAIISEFHKSQ